MKQDSIKVYSYRWALLGAFMFINLTIQILWICFAPISGLAAQQYGVSDMKIGLLAMTYMMVYIPTSIPASWLIDKYGFRKAVGLGAILLGVFGMLRGVFSGSYSIVLYCTIGLALAQPLLLNSYTTLAAKWFPIGERATASGLAMAACFIGTAIGLMLTPSLVMKYGIAAMQVIYGVVAAFSALVFLALAREAPPTPPGQAGSAVKTLMLDGLRNIFKSRDAVFSMALFFTGVGVFNGLATWIEDIVRPRGMTSEQAGMLGGLLLIGGIAGASVIPALSDKYRRRKPFILIGMVLAVPSLLGFIYLNTYSLMLVSVFLLGFFMIGMAPVGYQYVAEITYPVPEGTSNGLLVLAGQLSVIFIFAMAAMNKWLGSFTPSLLLGAGLMAINCILISMMKESNIRGDENTKPQ